MVKTLTYPRTHGSACVEKEQQSETEGDRKGVSQTLSTTSKAFMGKGQPYSNYHFIHSLCSKVEVQNDPITPKPQDWGNSNMLYITTQLCPWENDWIHLSSFTAECLDESANRIPKPNTQVMSQRLRRRNKYRWSERTVVPRMAAIAPFHLIIIYFQQQFTT